MSFFYETLNLSLLFANTKITKAPVHPASEPPNEHVTGLVDVMVHVELQTFSLPLAPYDLDDGWLIECVKNIKIIVVVVIDVLLILVTMIIVEEGIGPVGVAMVIVLKHGHLKQTRMSPNTMITASWLLSPYHRLPHRESLAAVLHPSLLLPGVRWGKPMDLARDRTDHRQPSAQRGKNDELCS